MPWIAETHEDTAEGSLKEAYARIVRGLGVMARAVGLVGHLLEATEHPMALEVWQRIDEEASAHARPAGE